MKSLILGVVLLTSIFTSASEYTCNSVHENASLEKPKTGPVLVYAYIYCNNYSNGNYNWYSKPTYWIPGSKLPGHLRIELERSFSKKITLLKGQDMFGPVLDLLLSSYQKENFPKITFILESIGMPSGSSDNAKVKLKNVIYDVLLTRSIKGLSVVELESIIYYGLKKGQEFGLVDKRENIAITSKETANSFFQKNTYAERYEVLDSNLSKIISLF